MKEYCHMCGAETDFTCERCEQWVCEGCCVPFTYHNQIDYALCNDCNDGIEADDAQEREREWAREAVIKAEKEKRATARKIAYWKPENVAKRKARKAAMLRERREANEKRMKETVKVVGQMFRGMF